MEFLLKSTLGRESVFMGESGSGKSTLCLALLALLPKKANVAGSIRFRGRDLCCLNESELEAVRGAEISMVFQEPALALHPTLPVGEQVADVIQAHSNWGRRRCRRKPNSLSNRRNCRRCAVSMLPIPIN